MTQVVVRVFEEGRATRAPGENKVYSWNKLFTDMASSTPAKSSVSGYSKAYTQESSKGVRSDLKRRGAELLAKLDHFRIPNRE